MLDARHTAIAVLNTLDQGKKTLDSILREIPQDEETLSRRDRALLTALVYGVLRSRGRLDHIISHFSNTPIAKIQPGVLNILRQGLFQIIFLDRIPDSAAVNTSVELTKQTLGAGAAGFVNALLRKAALKFNQVPFATFNEDPLAYLTSSQSIPEWLARRWLKRFSAEAIMALCKAINAIPPITIRANTLKTKRELLLRCLEDQVEHIELTCCAPDGINIRNPKKSIPHLEAHKEGWFQVQDEAAQLAALLLNPQPGESVLDACAGLGGKTAHLAQLMGNKGRITALDNDAKKLQQLADEMQRLGISIVKTACLNLQSPLDKNMHAGFDRILLDAPCSGLGVMRRNPDIKWNSSAARLKPLAEIQKRFLENVAAGVKVDGILVYAVCSIEPEENEAVIDTFLKKNPKFVIDKSLGALPKALCARVEPAAGFKTHPLFNQMDGFFLTRLKRIK